MPRVNQSVRGLVSGTITGNSTTVMVDRYNSDPSQGYAIEAGGFIQLEDAGPVDVTIQDANGLIVYTADALVASVSVPALPVGVKLPLSVVTETQTEDVNVFWTVKK